MRIIRETCVAGKTIDRTIKVYSGNHKSKRGHKVNITLENVQKNNDRLAAKNLMRILNANYKHGDLHIVLTYETEVKKSRARKDREYFIRKLRGEMKKMDIELKCVAVTEYKHTRIHHHLVINHFDSSALEQLWGKGFVKFSVLDDSGNYAKLAEYLIKETTKTMRDEDAVSKRRYTTTKNLIRPEVKREVVDIAELFDDPEPIKGYYIPQDYCRRFEHPVTGLEHLEYIMVALDEPRSYKTWPRGKKVKAKEYYKPNYEEEQQSLQA